MALMLILSLRPVCNVPESANIEELYIEPKEKRHYAPAKREGLFNWKSFFLFGDSVLKTVEKGQFKPLP